MALDLLVPSWSDAGGRHGFRPPGVGTGPGQPLRAHQVHGATVIEVGPGAQSPVGEADALVSGTVGLGVGIATADCVPILLDAAGAGVAAAVHAGWRGSLEGVALAALRHLTSRHGVSAADLRVALGPSIDGCCFEIEHEIAARFAARWGSRVWEFWRERPTGKGTLDLRGINALLLIDAGVDENAIERVGPCTFCGPGPWASYRREGPGCGRQLAWIAPGARP